MKDVHVFSTDMLDDDIAATFTHPWLAQHADGTIMQFPTEDEACAYQLDNGLPHDYGQYCECPDCTGEE